MTIPQFPQFSKLHIGHKTEMEKITNEFSPYSDFNFTSLWSYNVEDDCEVSILNENVVIKMRDYVTNEPFLMFIGLSEIKDTVAKLIEFSKEQNITRELKLIPEEVVEKMAPGMFTTYEITEDRDGFDYILSTQAVSELSGSLYKKRRYLFTKFTTAYPHITVRISKLADSGMKDEIVKLFTLWSKNKNVDASEHGHELVAVERILKSAKQLSVDSLFLFDGDKMIAFILFEKISEEYGICHFTKADISYKGVFEFLYQQTNEYLWKQGVPFLNREQDLGIPQLREAKSGWRPVKFLKKFIIKPKV